MVPGNRQVRQSECRQVIPPHIHLSPLLVFVHHQLLRLLYLLGRPVATQNQVSRFGFFNGQQIVLDTLMADVSGQLFFAYLTFKLVQIILSKQPRIVLLDFEFRPLGQTLEMCY